MSQHCLVLNHTTGFSEEGIITGKSQLTKFHGSLLSILGLKSLYQPRSLKVGIELSQKYFVCLIFTLQFKIIFKFCVNMEHIQKLQAVFFFIKFFFTILLPFLRMKILISQWLCMQRILQEQINQTLLSDLCNVRWWFFTMSDKITILWAPILYLCI